MARNTTVPCSKDTKETLESFGSKGETWDDLLSRLADKVEAVEETSGN